MRRTGILLVTLLLVTGACAAPPSDTTEAPTLNAELSDFKIILDRASVPAGHIVLGIRNHAAMTHEVKVIRTDVAPDKLPIDGGTAKVQEDGKAGELLNIGGGASRKLVLDLAPGSYVVLCNIAGHYQLGMRAGLEVK